MSEEDSRLLRRVERYKRKVEVLEELIEVRTRELYTANQQLEEQAAFLQQQVAEQTQALRNSLEEAQALSRAKTEFLARMSHELRTPMHGVLGMLDVLARTPLDDEQREVLVTAKGSGEHLVQVIGDILDFSKFASGGFSLEQRALDLAHLCDEVVRSYRDLASEHQIVLRADVPEQPLPTVFGDPLRLRQVLSNLVSNALKFTQAGSVIIRLSGEVIDGDVHACLEVQDSGIGISPTVLANLFQPFVQAEASTSRRFGGTGLGLSIVKELAVAMGGDVSVTSEVGKGSTFTLNLPLLLSEEEPEAEISSLHLSSSGKFQGLVLVADDQPVNRKIAEHMLGLIGLEVAVAVDGQAAVAAILEVEPDLVLMDCHMPRMSGCDAARFLRDAGVDVPIIAATADLTAENRKAVADAGMQGLLAKPYNLDTLVPALAPWLSVSGSELKPRPVQEQKPQECSVFDRQALLDAVGGDPDIVDLLVETLLDSLDPLLQDINDAADRGDATSFRRAGHALKGAAGSVQALALQQIALEVERSGSDGVVDLELVGRLRGEVEAFRAEV